MISKIKNYYLNNKISSMFLLINFFYILVAIIALISLKCINFDIYVFHKFLHILLILLLLQIVTNLLFLGHALYKKYKIRKELNIATYNFYCFIITFIVFFMSCISPYSNLIISTIIFFILEYFSNNIF